MHPTYLPSPKQPLPTTESSAKLPGHCQRMWDWERPFISPNLMRNLCKGAKRPAVHCLLRAELTVQPTAVHARAAWGRSMCRRGCPGSRGLFQIYAINQLGKWWVWPTNQRNMLSWQVQERWGKGSCTPAPLTWLSHKSTCGVHPWREKSSPSKLGTYTHSQARFWNISAPCVRKLTAPDNLLIWQLHFNLERQAVLETHHALQMVSLNRCEFELGKNKIGDPPWLLYAWGPQVPKRGGFSNRLPCTRSEQSEWAFMAACWPTHCEQWGAALLSRSSRVTGGLRQHSAVSKTAAPLQMHPSQRSCLWGFNSDSMSMPSIKNMSN